MAPAGYPDGREKLRVGPSQVPGGRIHRAPAGLHGIESALTQAKDAAQSGDVWLAGGASVVNQYLAAGLVDEIDVSIAPVVLGAGARLFEGVDRGTFEVKQVRAVDAPGVTHIKYEVR